MSLEINCIEPELIQVCLTEDGFTSCCYVTSHHLVPDKEPQLRAANLRAATAALEPAAAAA
jgi:hypothetical protein